MLKLTEALMTGRGNAVDRKILAELLGLKDRDLRRLIAAAREEGVPICNAQDGSGYYIAESIEDIDTQVKQFSSRRKKIDDQIGGLIKAKYKMMRELRDDPAE